MVLGDVPVTPESLRLLALAQLEREPDDDRRPYELRGRLGGHAAATHLAGCVYGQPRRLWRGKRVSDEHCTCAALASRVVDVTAEGRPVAWIQRWG